MEIRFEDLKKVCLRVDHRYRIPLCAFIRNNKPYPPCIENICPLKIKSRIMSQNQDLFDLVVDDVRMNPGTKQRETRSRLRCKTSAMNIAFKDAEENGVIQKNKQDGYAIV